MNRKLIEQKALDIQQEISIMKSLQHPNILRLYDVIDDPKVNKVYLITEFCQQGDLMNILKANDAKELQSIIKTNISCDDVLRRISFEIMKGLLFLHQNNIVHNDLKPSNILISRDGTVKLADFGVSGLGRVRLDDFSGTPLFQAPEVVSGHPHDGRVADAYSIGARRRVFRRPETPTWQVAALMAVQDLQISLVVERSRLNSHINCCCTLGCTVVTYRCTY